MNEFDSERIGLLLDKEGYRRADEPEKAEIIIFNTCSVRKKAEDRLYGHIGNLKSLKKKNPHIIICVGGCTAQSLGKRIFNDFPYVDIVFGTQSIERLPELIDRRRGGEKNICSISEHPGSFDSIYSFSRSYSFKSFLPVSVGCNNFCSYCIVPYVRGKEHSIEHLRIIETAKKLVDDGVAEIILLGQNVNSYGNDLDSSKKDYSFSRLLSDMAAIEGLKRIRFMTSHPKDFKKDIIRVLKENKNIMNHIHLPLQAGSDKILALMNRKYTGKEYINIYNYIKEQLPDCAVTTDIIVGFPGETAADFKQTLKLVKDLRFNRAFTFIYSPRRGTKAENYSDDISREEKQKWFKELLLMQNSISLEENSRLIGKKVEVLVEGRSNMKDQFEGRLENNTISNFESPTDPTGSFVKIRITGATSFYLTGELLHNAS